LIEATTAHGPYMQMDLLASERWFSIGLEKDQRDRLLFSAKNVMSGWCGPAPSRALLSGLQAESHS
jgi:hypothetical protein